MKIIKNDTVLIIAGKDRGRKGKVIKAMPKRNEILVEGLNIRKKTVRPKRSGEKGQIVDMPGPISVSNVKLICPKCKKPARVGYKVINPDKSVKKSKVRICKKCQSEI